MSILLATVSDFPPCRLSKPHSGATAVLVDELDARQIEGRSEHGNRLRLRAKPVSYRFFLGALAVWPRTAFAAADGLDTPAASAERAAAALVRRTPG
jgi:hypothetical protein